MGKTTVAFQWNSAPIADAADKAMAAGLKAAGMHARKAMKAELGGAPDSPAGGPPGKVSGNLRRAVQSKAFRKRGKYVGVEVGVLRPSTYDSKAGGKAYPGRMHSQALRLTRGYAGRDRRGRLYAVKARPFAQPVLARERRRMAEILEREAKSYMPRPKTRR